MLCFEFKKQKIQIQFILIIIDIILSTKMKPDIFLSTNNFSFTQNDTKAEIKMQKMINQARSKLPDEFYNVYTLTYDQIVRSLPLFKSLKTIPKGCMHHLHVDCTQDKDFYRQHIVTDPNVYLASDLKTFKYGTKEAAEKQNWVNMQDARKKFQSQQCFIQAISNITMFNKQQMKILAGNQKQIWDQFQIKIGNFFVLFFALHIFKKYIRHVLTKYAKNGYDRIEFRALLAQLQEFDQNGKLVKTHSEKTYIDAIDEQYELVKKQFPNLTIGFIFFGLKVWSDEQNYDMFKKVCELNWDKTIGLDFVQQEDLYGDLQSYDKVVDKILAQYPHLDYKKVYHAGETRDHLTRNIEIAVKAGSVRIGHGLNIMQRIDFLPYCQHICFEKNPVSNLVLGYKNDTRLSSAPILLGLGYAVSISPDDPGKFGLQDNTFDYFIAAVSYKWTLKHLKLTAIHSINHAICSEDTRRKLLKSFTKQWDSWILKEIQQQNITKHIFSTEGYDIFTSLKNWSFSQEQIQAEQKYNHLVTKTRNNLPKDFYYKINLLNNLDLMKTTQLYKCLKNIPKSVLQHNHFNCNEDFNFYKDVLIRDPNLYLTQDRKSLKYGTQQEAIKQNWVSLSAIRKQYEHQADFVQVISNISIFSRQQLKELSGHQKLIWEVFQKKMDAFMPIIQILHFFKAYFKFVVLKFINNGYDRIQLRATIQNLKEYDQKGKLIKVHEYKRYTDAADQVIHEIKQQYPQFSVGFIFAGLKAQSDEQNQKMFTKICELNWDKTVGFDFVQEQSLYGSLDKYNNIVDKVLKKFPHLDYKKVYHAGQSKDHLCNNLQIAVQSGSVRIGDGLNSLQRIEFLSQCKHVCFEKNPSTNLLLGYDGDTRTSAAPVLLGLGFAVTINADDPGKFRMQDATSDYFIAAVSYKWSLRHLKLIALHALNHSLTTRGHKIILEESFNNKWQSWIKQFLKIQF